MNAKYGIIILLIIGVLLFSGCTSDTKYEQPSNVNNNGTPSETTNVPSTDTDAPAPESQGVQTFAVGETATDGELNITVNSIRFTEKIDEQDNEFLVAEAAQGKEYLIIDITAENIKSDETQSVSTMFSSEIIDDEGYTYTQDFTGLTALDKAFKDGEILPGNKKRGELAFEVPKNATTLQFAFKFDMFTGTTALFDVK